MRITLQTVRDTLRGPFGHDSFIASFIKSVEPSKDCPTACITTEGLLRYNPKFAETYVRGPEDLFCLICHELMHPMFGHFIHGGGSLENLAADTFINAAISLIYEKPSGEGSLFKRLYKPEGIEGLLRPLSVMRQSRYDRLYDAFYSRNHYGQRLSTGEVIHALKILTPSTAVTVLFLGSHTESDRGAKFSTEICGKIAEDLKHSAKFDPQGGYGQDLFEQFIEVLNQTVSLKKAMLRKFETLRKVDRFLRETSHPRVTVSPVLLRPSKRDLVLLSAGIPPFHYHNQTNGVTRRQAGLAVYLDVSGSVNAHLPEIIALLRSFRNELRTIFLFSNAVVETSFEALLLGQVSTTFGTDFDCIAKSLVEQNLDKAVVLTDGYAALSPDMATELSTAKIRTLTVLFGGKDACPEFAPFGPVVQLDQIRN